MGSGVQSSGSSNSSGNISSSVINDSPAIQDENVPAEYRSALNKANAYSDNMHMSKAAIYDQLVSEYGEQFSAEAAQYAIDNMTADWNANALAKAKSYSDNMHMSKAGIYDQLVSEYGRKIYGRRGTICC